MKFNKKIPFFDNQKEIMNQLHGHYLFYKNKKKPIQREILRIFAQLLDSNEKYSLPSDFIEYAPIIKHEYGYENKNNSNYIVQFKSSEITYVILNSNDVELIKKIILFSNKNKIEKKINSISLVFYRYKDDWIFPDHCWFFSDDDLFSLVFLENKVTDKNTLKEYRKISKEKISEIILFLNNRKMEIKEREKNKIKIDKTPIVFYEKEKPKYKKETINKLKNKKINENKILEQLAKDVLK